MQLMGAVARERGFDTKLTDLLDPDTGVRWGLNHLWWLAEKYDFEWRDVVSAYNQGNNRRNVITNKYKNHAYVSKVSKFAERYGYYV